eukprot:Em0003g648a
MSVVGEAQSTLKISADVETVCESVGTYNGIKATKICTAMKNTVIDAQEGEVPNLQESSETANYLLSGPFCFVQTSEGKIVSVHYGPDEKPAIVNLKKAVAAAFQANFKYTEQEVEEDTLTTHVSQYRYENLGPDHWIMRRTVKPSDVIRFASNEMHRKSRLEVQKAEMVEYKEGVLLKSSGTLFVNAKGPMDTQDDATAHFTPADVDQASYDATAGSNELYGTGTYSLVLKKRSRKLWSASYQALLTTDDCLSAQNDEGQWDNKEMKRIRRDMPSILPKLDLLMNQTDSDSTGYKIRRLLTLESRLGPLAGHVPAIKEVNDYLRKLSNSTSEKDAKNRALLYSFVAAEGSMESQKTLVKAISETKDSRERNTLTVQLAFVPKVALDVLSLIEDMIKSSNTRSDPLVLTYGALASSLSPQLQSRALQFLCNCTDRNDDDTHVHLIHAMGNMESNLTDEHLINSLSHDSPSVRLAAIYALRHRTEWPEVQRSLLRTLRSFPSKDVTDMILRTLIAGAESHRHSYPEAVNDAFLEQLLVATEDDFEQRAMLTHYARLLGPTSSNRWFSVIRKKRGSVWNDNSKMEYNLVSNLENRNKDVINYPSNKAVLWGNKIGNSKINIAAAFGGFVGVGAGTADQPGGFKVLAKGVVQGQAFGHSATIFEAMAQSLNQPGSAEIKNTMYLKIARFVLLSIEKDIPACTPWALPLFETPDYPILDISPTIFIFVGFLKFHVSLTATLRLDLSLTVCVKDCISAIGQITPSIEVSATGGASASIAELVLGGVEVSANLNYKFTVDMTGRYKLYNGPFQFCLTLSHSWPNSYVKLSLYYQTRKIKFCKWRWIIHYVSCPRIQ